MAPSSTGSLRPERIGPYTILEKIGAGGMATVYRAFNPTTQQTVALKVLAIQFWDQAEARTRFVREAYLLQQLAHPHILPVYDFGEDGEMLYLVMPLLAGRTLADHLDEPLPLELIGRYTRQIASALDYAHARGVIHRDIKPANILLDNDNNVLLADFGVAFPTTAVERVTGDGEFIGTANYASPEQCRGDAIDRRSDLYSLAVLVFQMATGRLPFGASSPLAVIKQHLTEVPPNPLAYNPALPIEMYDVLLRGMAKLPQDRYPSALKLSEAVDQALGVQSEFDTGDEWLEGELSPVRAAPDTPVTPDHAPEPHTDEPISFEDLPVTGTDDDPFAGAHGYEYDAAALFFADDVSFDDGPDDDNNDNVSFAAAFGTMLLAVESINNTVNRDGAEQRAHIRPVIRPIGPVRSLPTPPPVAWVNPTPHLYNALFVSVTVLIMVAIGVMVTWRIRSEHPDTLATHTEPALGITFDYPAGWTLQTGPAAILARTTTGTVALADAAIPVAGPYTGASLVITLQKIDPTVVFGIPAACTSRLAGGPQLAFPCMAAQGYTTPVYTLYHTPYAEGVSLPGTLPPSPASLPVILLPTGDTPWIAVAIAYWDDYPDARTTLDTVAQSVR